VKVALGAAGLETGNLSKSRRPSRILAVFAERCSDRFLLFFRLFQRPQWGLNAHSSTLFYFGRKRPKCAFSRRDLEVSGVSKNRPPLHTAWYAILTGWRAYRACSSWRLLPTIVERGYVLAVAVAIYEIPLGLIVALWIRAAV